MVLISQVEREARKAGKQGHEQSMPRTSAVSGRCLASTNRQLPWMCPVPDLAMVQEEVAQRGKGLMDLQGQGD